MRVLLPLVGAVVARLLRPALFVTRDVEVFGPEEGSVGGTMGVCGLVVAARETAREERRRPGSGAICEIRKRSF